MIVEHHLERLVDTIVRSAHIRDSLRQRSNGVIDRRVLTMTPDELMEYLTGCAEPRRAAATALMHTNSDVVDVAAELVVAPDRIPEPTIEATAAESTSVVTQQDKDQLTRAKKPVDPTLELINDAPHARPTSSNEHLASEVAVLRLALGQSEQRERALERQVEQSAKELMKLRIARPSKRERRITRQRLREAERATEDRGRLEQRIEGLELEQARLIEQLSLREAERDQAKQERHEAMQARRSVEARINTIAGRAEYLRRLVATEITTFRDDARQMPQNQDRSKRERRAAKLQQLLDLLNELFPAESTQVETVLPATVPPLQVGMDRDLRVMPVGGGEMIGGSALLIEIGGRRILIDAGVIPHATTIEGMKPPRIGEVLARGLDACIVTHAHTDHAGFLPALAAHYPRLPIIASAGTAALLPTMWRDSYQVMSDRLDAESDRLEGVLPLYSEADMSLAEDRIQKIAFDRPSRLGSTDIEFSLFSVGHVLGAAGVVIRAGDRRVVVTGDIADRAQYSVDGAQIPSGLTQGADLLVIESTYCARDHRSRDAEVQDFVTAIAQVVEARGRVLVPAFALGRAQEVALILGERCPEIPVLIDGLAERVSRIYEQSARSSGRELEIFRGNVEPVTTETRYRQMRSFSSGVIITTSGMLTGGPAVAWASRILPDEHGALFLCGYQDEESAGKRLLRLIESGQPNQTIPLGEGDHQVEVPVRARVHKYNLSAHADRAGLTAIIDQVQPQAVMLVHGRREDQRQYRESLRIHGVTTVPTAGWRPSK